MTPKGEMLPVRIVAESNGYTFIFELINENITDTINIKKYGLLVGYISSSNLYFE